MIGAAANSYMLEWTAVSWGGALRDDPNDGFEGD